MGPTVDPLRNDPVSETDADAIRDGYPILRGIDREGQLETQAILER